MTAPDLTPEQLDRLAEVLLRDDVREAVVGELIAHAPGIEAAPLAEAVLAAVVEALRGETP